MYYGFVAMKIHAYNTVICCTKYNDNSIV